MGGNGSKESANARQGETRQRREQGFSQGEHKPKNDTFQFELGIESEFWFMLEIIRPLEYPAEKLRRWIVQESGISASLISGIKYLDRDVKRPAQVFVYCGDYNTVDIVCKCLPSTRGIDKVLPMPEGPQNKTTAFATSGLSNDQFKSSEKDHHKRRTPEEDKYRDLSHAVGTSNHTNYKTPSAPPMSDSFDVSDAYYRKPSALPISLSFGVNDACYESVPPKRHVSSNANCAYDKQLSAVMRSDSSDSNSACYKPLSVYLKNDISGDPSDASHFFTNESGSHKGMLARNENVSNSVGEVKPSSRSNQRLLFANASSSISDVHNVPVARNTSHSVKHNTSLNDEYMKQRMKRSSHETAIRSGTISSNSDITSSSLLKRTVPLDCTKRIQKVVDADTPKRFSNATSYSSDDKQKTGKRLVQDGRKQEERKQTNYSDFLSELGEISSQTLPQQQSFPKSSDVAASSIRRKNHVQCNINEKPEENRPGDTFVSKWNNECSADNNSSSKNENSENVATTFNANLLSSDLCTPFKDKDDVTLGTAPLRVGSSSEIKDKRSEKTIFNPVPENRIQNEENILETCVKRSLPEFVHCGLGVSDQQTGEFDVKSGQLDNQTQTRKNHQLEKNVEKTSLDSVAVVSHEEYFANQSSNETFQRNNQHVINAEISEKNCVGYQSVQANRLEKENQLKDNSGVKDNSTHTPNVNITSHDASDIPQGDETESVSDSMSVSSTMSDITEDSKHRKYPFVVVLCNLPLSMKRQDIASLFEQNTGFVKVLRTRPKGKATVVFSSAEQASNCAKQMNGSNVGKKKIRAHANILAKRDSVNFEKHLLDDKDVTDANEKVSGWPDNKQQECDFPLEKNVDLTKNKPLNGHSHKQQQKERNEKDRISKKVTQAKQKAHCKEQQPRQQQQEQEQQQQVQQLQQKEEQQQKQQKQKQGPQQQQITQQKQKQKRGPQQKQETRQKQEQHQQQRQKKKEEKQKQEASQKQQQLQQQQEKKDEQQQQQQQQGQKQQHEGKKDQELLLLLQEQIALQQMKPPKEQQQQQQLQQDVSQNKLYVVVDNLNTKFNANYVKKLFMDCPGVVGVTKDDNKKFARVYFESIDLAGKAIDRMNGWKKLKVTAGVDISQELAWRKLERQVEEYLANLQENRKSLLNKNEQELKDLEAKTPESRPQRKQISLEEFERLKEERKTYELKKQELKAQRNEFENKFQLLVEGFECEIKINRRVNKKAVESILETHRNITERELKKFEASLPIYAKRTEILETVGSNGVVVLIGETGSGKSTQLAQYLAEEKSSEVNRIVVTQPRKIAAISLAKRVSQEFGCKVGEEVGYHVGLDKKVNDKKTIIKFVTDRILLNEVLEGAENMLQYSCIIIDEAHERSIHTDLLVAMLKRQLPSFPHLKLIVTSATLNTDVFRKYFDDCPVVKVPGRTFPVERVYLRERPVDYVDGVHDKVMEVCESGEKGDILVFLTQQNEIEKTCERLRKKLQAETIILPLHGKLQSDEQQEVFKETPKGKRKIVVATNSAETSLTINGIRIVIDCGMVKEPSFDPAKNMTTLDVKHVSQSSATQRAGRAGRTGPGKCYCMYTEEDYNNMESSTKPEILKMHLGMAVLQLLSLGVTDIEQFDFVESPPRDALAKARESLKLLGALDQDGTLNELGKEMLQLPTEPQLSKALLVGLDQGCGDDIIIAAALMASGHDVFYRGSADKRNECAIQKQEFCQTSGDLLSAIDVYKKWIVISQKKQVAWCMANALNSKSLRSAGETSNEIKQALLNVRPGQHLEVTAENIQESLCKSLLAGYFENIAWSFGHEKLGYMAVPSNQTARIHPSSVLSSLGDQPVWVLYQQLKRTNDQVFLLNVTPIQYEWLAEVAMHTLQYIDEDTIARSRVVRERIYPVGPELVKAVIGYQGSTIKKIETSVSHCSARFPAINTNSVFCAVECNVDRGMIDVCTTEDCLGYAKELVNDVIKTKRYELESYSEVFISNVGGLKTLVKNDLKTVLVLQPGTSCKLDVFVEKEDVSQEIDSDGVRDIIRATGKVIHDAVYTITRPDERYFKWGDVTYSDPGHAKKVCTFIRSALDEDDLPYNVREIQLKPSRRIESATSQSNTQLSGVNVLVSWFPLPASEKAYVKCTCPDIAQEIVHNLNQQLSSCRSTAFVKKSGGDIAFFVEQTDDEFTVRKKLEECCTAFQVESITKITVPSKPPREIDLEEEKEKLIEVMKQSGALKVLRLWVANCQKVRACVMFEDLDCAGKVIKELNGKMDIIGVRAIYLEFQGKREVTCDGRVYDKIKKEIFALKDDNNVSIEVETRQKRKKIIVTGDDREAVQIVGATVADLLTPEIVLIEDAGVAKLLSRGYGRAKVRQIQKKNDVIIQTSNFGRRIQITARPNAKLQARVQIEKLIEELQKTSYSEIDLGHSDRPVGAIREILKYFGKDLSKLVEEEDCQASMEIRRRKLVLNGVKEAVNKVENKVEEFLKTLPNSQREENVNECPVCLADIEDPHLLTLCGHAYCSACISQYLNNVFDSVKSPDMFPQKCLSDKCESPVIKEDYLALLNTDQVEKLYRVSLECFLIGNPEYKPCPTPDCSWVYEITDIPSVFACPECDTSLCKKCGDSAHQMFDTCEAFKSSKGLSKADQQLMEWAKGADTRQCPKCSVMIEKDKGCSHVNCKQCNAHICWKCGRFYKTSEECYAHIDFCEKK